MFKVAVIPLPLRLSLRSRLKTNDASKPSTSLSLHDASFNIYHGLVCLPSVLYLSPRTCFEMTRTNMSNDARIREENPTLLNLFVRASHSESTTLLLWCIMWRFAKGCAKVSGIRVVCCGPHHDTCHTANRKRAEHRASCIISALPSHCVADEECEFCMQPAWERHQWNRSCSTSIHRAPSMPCGGVWRRHQGKGRMRYKAILPATMYVLIMLHALTLLPSYVDRTVGLSSSSDCLRTCAKKVRKCDKDISYIEW